MKKIVIRIVNLITVALIAVFIIGYAFAWFGEDRIESDQTFGGSSGTPYFESGTGSSTDPFVISNRYHMYNLAWLQNTGKLTEKYYFEIKDEITSIDLKGTWLPPIGTDQFPFVGDFDGNGKTIENLKITTDKSKLSQHGMPSGTGNFSNAVGMFAKTSGSAEIHNFILDKPIVEVANTNTYSTGTKMVAGLAVGLVSASAKVYSIGVLANSTGSVDTSTAVTANTENPISELVVSRTGYSTFNSIIGDLEEGATSSVTGGGYLGSGGSGSAFGASFDVEGMYDRLKLIETNKNSTTPAWRLPNLGDSSDVSITIAKLEKLPFAVLDSTVANGSTYSGASAKEVIDSNNIGYLIGNQNKVYNRTITFGDLLSKGSGGDWVYSDGKSPANGKFPRWIYKSTATEIASDTYSSSNGFAPLTQSEFNSMPQGIKNLIPETSGTVTGFNSIRLSQTYQNAAVQIYSGTESNGQWSPHGQIGWMGNTYGDGFIKGSYKDPVVNEDGILMNADGVLLDDTYYDGTNKTKCYQYDIVDGVRYYRPASEEWTLPIYGIDENGHAKNENGKLYDSGGYLIDDEGYAYNELGYIVSTNEWPIQGYSIDSEGYIVKSDGSYYIDAEGNKIYAYGYDKNSSGQLVYKSGDKAGQAAGISMGGYSAPLKAKKGVHVDAKEGKPCEFYRYNNGIALPNSGIWFKPSQVGKIRFVMFAESSGDGFALIKGKRKSATKENPFIVDYSKNGSDIEATEVGKYKIPKNVLFYYEFDVSAADIEDGRFEYWLMQYGDGGAYFVYMDLGASEADDQDTTTIAPDKNVSAIDFIYQGVEIAQSGDTATTPAYRIGDFIVRSSGSVARYEATGTSIYFENLKQVLKIVYLRKAVTPETTDPTMQVAVTGATSAIDQYGGVTETKTKADISFDTGTVQP